MQGAVLTGPWTPFSNASTAGPLLAHWPIPTHLPSPKERHGETKLVLLAALDPLLGLEVPHRSGWAQCCLPGFPTGTHRAHSSPAPGRKSTLSRSWSNAPCLCWSLTSSLPTLAGRGSKPKQIKKQRGAKHWFWPEHHGEAGVVALGFSRLLILDGERRLCSPPGKVMMDDEKSQLVKISSSSPKAEKPCPVSFLRKSTSDCWKVWDR